ncbi:M15 family metallopeptidase [Streptomyces aurantiacus]|uniref:D-alanyl-D-alanine carboxypeptidase-like core domain-containing protein n=1 Tax=Streptomyces aurantiacus JA 4570 TaxID=1286094 RepID=S3ZNM8_9ACTN|nr:M15 family metallopeptidase [Streptomyces aurantiacus]EPH44409.1 hypothetical protein STRAU_2541 [Streptomyces aurantiacus JA 4570]
MTRTPPSARTTTRRIHWLLAIGLIAVIAAITAAFGHQSQNSSNSSNSSKSSSSSDSSGSSAGAVPDGVTVFDDEIPAVVHLDPDLLKALRRAATDAADDGVEFYVNSGWRSPEYQNQLLREAVSRYGSEDQAARWVATVETSPHVAGDAVDIGRSEATAWLSGHGAEYGLCQIYRNEPWHYELRTHATDGGCPRMYADPTQDPRMQQ